MQKAKYDFYVVQGKRLIDYKPQVYHYRNALNRLLEENKTIFGSSSFEELMETNSIVIDKLLFLVIKTMKKVEVDKMDEETVEHLFKIISLIGTLVGAYTPRKFIRLFPIRKDYNGYKTETKDYFSCMEYIKGIGIDTPIGENAAMFLMEYWNWDINFYMVTWMSIVSAIDIMRTGRDSMMDFLEEKGLHFHAMQQVENILINEETGEQFQIEKPKSKMQKLFSVVK